MLMTALLSESITTVYAGPSVAIYVANSYLYRSYTIARYRIGKKVFGSAHFSIWPSFWSQWLLDQLSQGH